MNELKIYATNRREYSTLRTVALLLLFVLAGITVQADESAKKRFFDIREQPLDSALIEFSEQADIQVMIATELVGNLRSVGIRGRYFPDEALRVLIESTGLTFHAVGENAIAVVKDDGA